MLNLAIDICDMYKLGAKECPPRLVKTNVWYYMYVIYGSSVERKATWCSPHRRSSANHITCEINTVRTKSMSMRPSVHQLYIKNIFCSFVARPRGSVLKKNNASKRCLCHAAAYTWHMQDTGNWHWKLSMNCHYANGLWTLILLRKRLSRRNTETTFLW